MDVMKQKNKKDLTGGLYLVADPSMDKKELLYKLDEALFAGVQVVQIWNHWPSSFDRVQKEKLISEVMALAGPYGSPVLINEEWELLKTTDLDGVHFDKVPADIGKIREALHRDFILGITCSNDLEIIRWANQKRADYISFCSMFPSSSAGSCEIVDAQTVKKAREITDLPLFVSGGITPENLPELTELPISGVAVISGILGSESPGKNTEAYKKQITRLFNI